MRLAPGVRTARLNGRDTNKPDAWSRPVRLHRYRSVDRCCPDFQRSSVELCLPGREGPC